MLNKTFALLQPHTFDQDHMYIYIYIYTHTHVCVCMCVMNYHSIELIAGAYFMLASY